VTEVGKAYKIIRTLKMDKPTTYALLKRQATTLNMGKEAAADADGNFPPAKKIAGRRSTKTYLGAYDTLCGR
jgi:hypothetical protein